MAYTDRPHTFLGDIVARVLAYTDEPVGKWTTDKVWPLVVDAWQALMTDVAGLADNPLTVYYDFLAGPAILTVLLPANVGQLLSIGRRDSTNNLITEVLYGVHRRNIYGPQITFEGSLLRFMPKWLTDETLTAVYVPNGHCPIHTGLTDSSSTYATSTTLVLDTEPEEGYFDAQPNAYLGAVIRLIEPIEVPTAMPYTVFPVQERVITAYNPETCVATVDIAFDFDFALYGLGLIRYEVLPWMAYAAREAVAWHIAAKIHAAHQKNPARVAALQHYRMASRAVRLNAASYNMRSGQRMPTDSVLPRSLLPGGLA